MREKAFPGLGKAFFYPEFILKDYLNRVSFYGIA